MRKFFWGVFETVEITFCLWVGLSLLEIIVKNLGGFPISSINFWRIIMGL